MFIIYYKMEAVSKILQVLTFYLRENNLNQALALVWCCLMTCICRACLVGQVLPQNWQDAPPLSTCLDSM